MCGECIYIYVHKIERRVRRKRNGRFLYTREQILIEKNTQRNRSNRDREERKGEHPSPRLRAKPKSQSFTIPSRDTRIFSGFTSLWIMLFVWQNSSPRSTCHVTFLMYVSSRLLACTWQRMMESRCVYVCVCVCVCVCWM